MALKQDYHDTILRILKRNGRLTAPALQELVQNSFPGKDYKKSTFYNHLSELKENKKIICNESVFYEGNKKKSVDFYSVANFDHKIQGGLLLEALGGRINGPDVILTPEIKISEDIPGKIEPNHHVFIFQFNCKTICLTVPKALMPFNIHLSKKDIKEEIYKEVNSFFENRTFVIELPINKISRFNKDLPNKVGHLFLKINEQMISATDLKATFPADIAVIEKMTLDDFKNDISLISDLTIDAKSDMRSSKIKVIKKLEQGQSVELKIPSLILLSEDAQLAIF